MLVYTLCTYILPYCLYLIIYFWLYLSVYMNGKPGICTSRCTSCTTLISVTHQHIVVCTLQFTSVYFFMYNLYCLYRIYCCLYLTDNVDGFCMYVSLYFMSIIPYCIYLHMLLLLYLTVYNLTVRVSCYIAVCTKYLYLTVYVDGKPGF